MEILSLTQLKNYCEKHTDIHYIYDTRNSLVKSGASTQFISKHGTVSFSGYYSSVIVLMNPNRICLKNPHNTVVFNNIEQITIDHDYIQGISDVISITCKNDDTRHIIIADHI